MNDGPPPFTILDAELAALAKSARAAGTAPSLRTAGVPVLSGREAAASEAAREVPARPRPAKRTSLKLLVRPGQAESVQSWVKRRGGKVVSPGDRVLLAELPMRAMTELEQAHGSHGVQRAEMPRILLPRLDACRGPATGLATALDRHGLTGEGVVLGIVDTGVDWSHPDFTEEDGSSRIELFLHAHRHGLAEVSKYDRYERQALNDALSNKKKVPQGDPNGHGTHCASIAAGSGAASGKKFCGVAPRAALMAMRSEPLLDDHVIFAIREIFARAGERPAVISLSLGHHYGAHDGTASLENVIAQESGPGRIIVVAAGNEGRDGIHWHGELVEGGTLEIPFRIADSQSQYVDVWIPRGDVIEDLWVEAPDGALLSPEGGPVTTNFGTCTATWRRDRLNRDCNLNLVMEQGQEGAIWKIHLKAGEVLHGEVHAWSGTPDPRTSRQLFPEVTDPRFSVGIPATEERAIAVAAWVCRSSYETLDGELHDDEIQVGQLSSFSSQGPTRHGVLKPDIAAPGQYITAALAAKSVMQTSSQYKPRHHPSGSYITLQGTSMATPFVAGVIALMLQREPRLTPEEIQQRLRVTARRDRDTRRVWSNGFGFGKIDVEALLDYEAD